MGLYQSCSIVAMVTSGQCSNQMEQAWQASYLIYILKGVQKMLERSIFMIARE